MNTTALNKDIAVIYLKHGVLLDTEMTGSKQFYTNKELLTAFKETPYKALFYFGFEEKRPEMSVSLSFLHSIVREFINHLSQDPDIEFTREASPLSDEDIAKLLHNIPFCVGMEDINADWLNELWGELSSVFAKETAEAGTSVAEYLTSHNSNINVVGRVYFHLVENKSDDYPFAFLATYSTASTTTKKVSHVPLKNALVEYKGQQDMLLKLLATVSKAADKSTFISELVESGELFSPLRFTVDEAYVFLKEIPFYEECGILCRMPDWWRKRTNAVRLSLQVGDKAPSQVGMDALLSFDPAIYLGDEKLTREEIEMLLSQTSGLSLLKGKWVEVDHEKLQSVLAAYEEASALGDMTLQEAIRMQLGLNAKVLSPNADNVEITNGSWLNSIRDRLLNPSDIENLEVGHEFKATLRQYQQIGFEWLATMKSLGFGALLADDMGLGKTVQILALLEYLHENSSSKALLIVPASLIGNWMSEIEKFAPNLRYAVLHAGNTELNIEEAELFITTYGMTVRLETLRSYRWDMVILDEAQAIKNPGTKQTKAVKQLQSSFKIAMTGTPIENKLSDLWSLFDFLNTGILGSAKEFTTFTKNMQDSDSYSRLREVVSPFILRRLKTDKTIIDDLPDKIEMKAYVTLTKKQVVLYNGLVKEIIHTLETAEGIERKGVVLASIMKFKQICNHPDQYLGQAEFNSLHSGKFDKLREICETIYEKRERVLVFTQFREMVDPIAQYLETVFHRKGLVLHGGTQVKKRSKLVEQFNGENYVPYMVLSLKAGGVGLNLTSANHVIHFDRWWNPAVENQATDRVFRIGQKKNVVVHKFIATGTIEEKIDNMIAEKQKLASDIIGSSGENWITEMSNDELIQLFTLK